MTTLDALTTRVQVCAYERLVPELGVAALVGDLQVALFRLSDGQVHAVQNLDPFSGASVISRGITGSKGDEPTVASPVYKQVFSLVTGRCLADLDKQPRSGLGRDLAVFGVAVEDGQVIVEVPLEIVEVPLEMSLEFGQDEEFGQGLGFGQERRAS
ncbi:nitrite reductase small subunit NirD [Aestuariimicrobium soli]|uniref:nitrite reductase small subunit NirD n=1 Tax=Aestuariimicrobium soli TaxID=2035834 RepID=UPI003EC07BC1